MKKEIKCLRCNENMKILKKFSSVMDEPNRGNIGSDTQLILFATKPNPKKIKLIDKKYKSATPDIYVCPICGHVEYILPEEELETIKKIEEDEKWDKRNFDDEISEEDLEFARVILEEYGGVVFGRSLEFPISILCGISVLVGIFLIIKDFIL